MKRPRWVTPPPGGLLDSARRAWVIGRWEPGQPPELLPFPDPPPVSITTRRVPRRSATKRRGSQ